MQSQPSPSSLKAFISASGTSIIKHKIRVALALSLEEYVLLDFLYNWNAANSGSPNFKDYFKATGIIPDDVKAMFKKLHTEGFLVMDKEKKRVTTTEKWGKHFDTSDAFEKLWKRHPRGNKPTARNRFRLASAKIDPEELYTKLEAYLQNCAEVERFPKNLDTWLQPDKERWNDPLIPTGKEGAAQEKQLDNYFKEE